MCVYMYMCVCVYIYIYIHIYKTQTYKQAPPRRPWARLGEDYTQTL